MEFLKYKGYIGSIHYSHEDKVFWGKLEIENGLITFDSIIKFLVSCFENNVFSIY